MGPDAVLEPVLYPYRKRSRRWEVSDQHVGRQLRLIETMQPPEDFGWFGVQESLQAYDKSEDGATLRMSRRPSSAIATARFACRRQRSISLAKHRVSTPRPGNVQCLFLDQNTEALALRVQKMGYETTTLQWMLTRPASHAPRPASGRTAAAGACASPPPLSASSPLAAPRSPCASGNPTGCDPAIPRGRPGHPFRFA